MAWMDAERHYYQRLRQFEGESAEPGGIVMVGSSHVEGFDAGGLLPGRRIVNRGIAGDRLSVNGRGVLHRLEVSVFACRPAAVIFESGTNDLGELWRIGRPAMDEIETLYERAVSEIRRRLPVTPMLLVSVFPTGGRFAGMTSLAPPFNERIQEVAQRHGCAYQDLYSRLVDRAGELTAALTDDGLHLNAAGYRIWADLLSGWLQSVHPGTEERA